MVNRPKYFWNLHHSTFIIFIDHCQGNWVWKILSLLTWQNLGLLVNTLAANDKYPVLYRDTLMILIQMQLSQKQRKFSQYFTAFLKSTLNFEYFEQKDDRHRFCISDITDSENVVRWMSKNSCFRGPFHKQLGKRVRTLLKSSSQKLYHTYW